MGIQIGLNYPEMKTLSPLEQWGKEKAEAHQDNLKQISSTLSRKANHWLTSTSQEPLHTPWDGKKMGVARSPGCHPREDPPNGYHKSKAKIFLFNICEHLSKIPNP